PTPKAPNDRGQRTAERLAGRILHHDRRAWTVVNDSLDHERLLVANHQVQPERLVWAIPTEIGQQQRIVWNTLPDLCDVSCRARALQRLGRNPKLELLVKLPLRILEPYFLLRALGSTRPDVRQKLQLLIECHSLEVSSVLQVGWRRRSGCSGQCRLKLADPLQQIRSQCPGLRCTGVLKLLRKTGTLARLNDSGHCTQSGLVEVLALCVRGFKKNT